MIYLNSSDTLTLTTSTSSALDVNAYVTDIGNTTSFGRQITKITTANTTNVVDFVTTSGTRQKLAEHISVVNVGTVSNVVTLSFFNGSVSHTLYSTTLLAKERFEYSKGRFSSYDANGVVKNGVVSAIGGALVDGDKGEITVSSSGTIWTINNQAVSFAKMASIPTATVVGRISAGTGVPQALTTTDLTTLVNTFSPSLKGSVPLSGGGTANFLRADGNWTTPLSALADGDKGDITVTGSGAVWRVDDGAITNSKLLVPKFGTSITRDPVTKDVSAWENGSNVYVVGDTSGSFGDTAIACSTNFQVSLEKRSPIDSSKDHLATITIRQSSGSNLAALLVAFEDAAGNNLDSTTPGATGWPAYTSYAYFGLITQTCPSVYTTYTISFGPNETAKIPTGATHCRIGWLNMASAGAGEQRIKRSFIQEKIGNAQLGGNVVSLGNMAAISTNTFLGRTSPSTGNVENLSVAQTKTVLAYTPTDIGAATIAQANATHTGDATGATSLTLATVNANVGSFGLVGSVAQFIVNAKGLVTSAANVAISVASTAINDSTAAGRAFLTAATTAAQTALLDVFTTTNKGLVPAPVTNNTTDFLRRDGSWAAPAGGGGGVTDGDKGDITVTGTGSVWTVDPGAVTLSKMDVVGTQTVFYRTSAGTGAPEVQTLATLKSALGLTGTNSGDQPSIVGISGTKAQFNTAVSDGDIQFVGDAPTAHTHLLAAGATDVTITAANLNVLDDGVDTTLHFHAADRARANHTGTQPASSVTGLATVATSGSAADLSAGVLPAARFDDTAHGARAGGTLHSNVIAAGAAGFMTGADKTKLDGVTAGANLYVHPNHSGDATSAGDGAVTLATVNANVGSFGSSTAVATFTVDGKGRTTAAAAVGIAIPLSQVTQSAATTGQVPQWSGSAWVPATVASGVTNLSYTPSTRTINSSSGTGVVLPWFDSTFAGLVPASGGGTLNFLRADGSFATPPTGGITDGDKGDVIVSGSGTVWNLDPAAQFGIAIGVQYNVFPN